MTNRYLVFGASHGTGLEVARQLTARGDRVTAVVRQTSDRSGLEPLGVDFVIADVLDAAAVDAAFRSGDHRAVVCTVGGSRKEPQRPDVIGTQNIVDSAKRHGVRRMVLVTAVGAGDSRKVLSENAWKFLGPVIELKTAAEACLTASGLDATILRPGGMNSDAATGTAIKTEDHGVMGTIQRADLAAIVIECLDDDTTIGRIYHTIDPGIGEQPPLQRGEAPQAGEEKP